MGKGKWEIFKDKSGEYRFRLRAGNGEVVLSSEGYKNRGDAEATVKLIQSTEGGDSQTSVDA